MEIHIGDRVADVELISKEGNKVQLSIDGTPYDVDIVMAENGNCSVLHEGNSFNVEFIRNEGEGKPLKYVIGKKESTPPCALCRLSKCQQRGRKTR